MSFLNAVKIKLGLYASATDNFVIESTGQGSGQIRKGDLATTGNTLMNWNSGGVNGIAFAPTQVASSDPNTLDDYKEGTWTPTDSSGAGLTFTGASGSYVKIGSLVTAKFSVTYPATADASVYRISLPFVANSSAGNGSATVTYTNIGANAPYSSYIGVGTQYVVGVTNAGAGITNATMSGKRIDYVCVYTA